MHERTERLLCRLAFVLACALPTLITCSLVLVTWTPWYHARQIEALQRQLVERLGVGVEIGRFSRLAPDVWQLEDVLLRNPETGAEAGRIRTVYYHQGPKRVGVILSQPQLQARELGTLWDLVHQRVICQPELYSLPIHVEASDLSLLDQASGLTLTPLKASLEPRPEQTTAIVQFLMAGQTLQQRPATITVERSRGEGNPRTSWTLESGGTPLPCNVLAGYLPVMRRLGIDATFSGLLRWEQDREDYSFELVNARFDRVNLLDLCEPLDCHLSGYGTLRIDQLVRHRGEPIKFAQGRMMVERGRIDADLLRRLAEFSGAEINDRFVASDPRLDCQLISFGFQLQGPQLRIQGLGHEHRGFEHMAPGTIVVAENRCIMRVDPLTALSTEMVTSVMDPRGVLRGTIGDQQRWSERFFGSRLPPNPESSGGQSVHQHEPSTPRVSGVRLQPESR